MNFTWSVTTRNNGDHKNLKGTVTFYVMKCHSQDATHHSFIAALIIELAIWNDSRQMLERMITVSSPHSPGFVRYQENASLDAQVKLADKRLDGR